LSICDIVLNHTANESEWLFEHPEATFNVFNMPHLRPAYLFDRTLWRVTCEVAEGKWAKHGVPVEVTSEDHLQNLARVIRDEFLPLVKIHELFMVDADRIVQALRDVLRANPPNERSGVAFGSPEFKKSEDKIVILQDPEFRRFKSTVEFDLAVRTYGVSM
jgi:glycogen debranching enzyme